MYRRLNRRLTVVALSTVTISPELSDEALLMSFCLVDKLLQKSIVLASEQFLETL